MNTDNANKFLDERQIYQRDVWDSKDIEPHLDCLLEDYHQEKLKLLGITDVSDSLPSDDRIVAEAIMEQTELEQYQKLTKFQKDVVDALKNLGFKHKYFSTYEKLDWGIIKVDKFSRWSDVLKYVHEQGKDQKRLEFQRVLGI